MPERRIASASLVAAVTLVAAAGCGSPAKPRISTSIYHGSCHDWTAVSAHGEALQVKACCGMEEPRRKRSLTPEQRQRLARAIDALRHVPTSIGDPGLCPRSRNPLWLTLEEPSGAILRWKLCRSVQPNGREGFAPEIAELLDAMGYVHDPTWE